MDVIRSAGEWAERLGESRKGTVVTIGNFDGVHLGHQKILRGVTERARRDHLSSAVLTFYPHPARVLRPEAAPSRLMTLEQRLAAFEAAGIDATLVLQFDAALAKVSAEEFAQRFLVDTLRARAVLVGGNFRFGHRQVGDDQCSQGTGDAGRGDGKPHVILREMQVVAQKVRNENKHGREDKGVDQRHRR